jgi:hypothetical protein
MIPTFQPSGIVVFLFSDHRLIKEDNNGQIRFALTCCKGGFQVPGSVQRGLNASAFGKLWHYALHLI